MRILTDMFGSLPLILLVRVPLEMKQTWASFFEAASGLNLGNEYVERVVVVAVSGLRN